MTFRRKMSTTREMSWHFCTAKLYNFLVVLLLGARESLLKIENSNSSPELNKFSRLTGQVERGESGSGKCARLTCSKSFHHKSLIEIQCSIDIIWKSFALKSSRQSSRASIWRITIELFSRSQSTQAVSLVYISSVNFQYPKAQHGIFN